MRAGERGTAAEQLANLREACASLVPLLDDPEIVVTHGNGPQVGNELVRQERAADEVPPLPLYLAVAQTQAEIGALIEAELRLVAGRPVACLLTHVRVDESDPAFAEPTKPVGPFYAAEQAETLERDRGWRLKSDSGRGYRRVVPSPAPLEILELGAIRALLAAGTCAIACGGGGIPVASRNGRLSGIDAVIDKDRASALLARAARCGTARDPDRCAGGGPRVRHRRRGGGAHADPGRSGEAVARAGGRIDAARRSRPRSSSSARPADRR